MNLLEVRSVSKTYGQGEAAVRALKDVSFSVSKGEFVAVVGESGSGKSTLLNMIGGLDMPTYRRDRYFCDERRRAYDLPQAEYRLCISGV